MQFLERLEAGIKERQYHLLLKKSEKFLNTFKKILMNKVNFSFIKIYFKIFILVGQDVFQPYEVRMKDFESFQLRARVCKILFNKYKFTFFLLF